MVFAKVMNTNPPTNTARTSPDDADLRTRVYGISLDDAAKQIAALPLSSYRRSWVVIEQKHDSEDEIQIVFHVPVVVFTDILTVSLRCKDKKHTEVNIESRSQVGQGDFGENRRHIRQILSVMDTSLA